MKRHRSIALLLALLLSLATLLGAPAGPRVSAATTAPGNTTDTQAGVIAAIGCGLGLRSFNSLAAGGVGGVLIVVSLCAYMIMDGLWTPDAP